MSAIRIAHLSPTPLVAAPRKIADMCARLGADTTAIAASDYPGPLAEIFKPGYLVWRNAHNRVRDLIARKISEANILHIHNELPREFAPFVTANSGQRIIYHVHSPKREGPVYVDRTEAHGLHVSEKLVVGQIWPRLWRDFRPVPNIVNAEPSLRLIKDDEMPRVLFAPAHKREGRWGGKVSTRQSDVLAGLAKAGLIDLVELDRPIAPDELLALRRTVHVTVDEVVTGGFHQISLEGLCAGNVVINGADHFSLAMFTQAARADAPPPFVRASEQTLAETLARLVLWKELIREHQQQSYDYYREWLGPERLASIYMEIYRDVLDRE
jgi:hypothetical protein